MHFKTVYKPGSNNLLDDSATINYFYDKLKVIY